MKLHLLEMQAFGPFSGKEAVDFSALGDNALFLIDGQTGAGKTSILHAICYALYGETTDTERKDMGLRCDFAKADVLTTLFLEFSIRGEKYRISRVPTQRRPSKRGAGETQQIASAHFRKVTKDNKEETLVAKKTTDASVKIQEVIGLTAQQFLQVMVLPQGKFRELLLAKNNRQEVWSTLFQTEIYKQIERLLKDRAGNINKQNTVFEQSKAEAFNDVKVLKWDELVFTIDEAQSLLGRLLRVKQQAETNQQHAYVALNNAEALTLLFESQNDKDRALQHYQQQTHKIEEEKKRIEKANKAESIIPQWQRLQAILVDIKTNQTAINQAQIEQTEAETKVSETKQAVVRIDKEYQQRDCFKAQEAELEGYQQILKDYQSLKGAFAEADKECQGKQQQESKLKEHSQQTVQELDSLSTMMTVLRVAIGNKADIVEQKLKAKEQLDKRQALEVAREALESSKGIYNQQEKLTEAELEEYEALEGKANRIEMQWFSNQAAVLAEKLAEDVPCAVCGSVDHPEPARFLEGELKVNQDGVDEAKKNQAEQLKKLNACKEKLQQCLSAMRYKETEVNTLKIQLANDANKALLIFKGHYQALVGQLNEIEGKESQLVKAEQQQTKKQAEYQQLAGQIQAVNSELSTLDSIKIEAKTKLNQCHLPQDYQTVTAINTALEQLVKKIEVLETQYKTTHQQMKVAETVLTERVTTVQGLIKSLDSLKSRQEFQVIEWERALVSSKLLKESHFQRAKINSQALSDLMGSVAEYDRAVTALETELALLKTQLKNEKLPDLMVLQRDYEQFKEAQGLAEQAWLEADKHCSKLNGVQEKIKQIEIAQKTIKKDYEVIGKLAKLASGEGEGAIKVSLERFVLGNILNKVLAVANQRLSVMSKKQYQLMREDETHQKKSSHAGLDLAINDAHTGKVRPIATLSGGESFMASLALALGLSEVVQEHSGGIQLETLFIDEGFGSLDQESLQLAINTLRDLQSSGRSIGIISHVSELKEQMKQRIEVVRLQGGSSIKVVM